MRKYYESIVHIAPDVVHHLVRSEIFVSAQPNVLVATTRLIYDTRVFRDVTQALADITLTSAPKAAHPPDTSAGRLLGVEDCRDEGSDDDRDSDDRDSDDRVEPLRIVARLRSTDPDDADADADAPTARRKLPQARVALEKSCVTVARSARWTCPSRSSRRRASWRTAWCSSTRVCRDRAATAPSRHTASRCVCACSLLVSGCFSSLVCCRCTV